MAEERETGRPAGVSVVDVAVPETGWQRLDLAPLAGLPPSAPLDLAGSFTKPAAPEVAARPRPMLSAVPDEALVAIARREPGRRFAKRGPGPGANDNGRPGRLPWRDLVFLGILLLTVVGAFWGGRLQGYQRIIVAPQPVAVGGVIT